MIDTEWIDQELDKVWEESAEWIKYEVFSSEKMVYILAREAFRRGYHLGLSNPTQIEEAYQRGYTDGLGMVKGTVRVQTPSLSK